MANWTQEMRDAVWLKASASSHISFRKDQCGAWIQYEMYGNRNSPYGWEIDHITPQSNGGTDVLSNLRPLHWENNVAKSNGRLKTANPAVKAFDDKNARLGDDGKYYYMT